MRKLYNMVIVLIICTSMTACSVTNGLQSEVLQSQVASNTQLLRMTPSPEELTQEPISTEEINTQIPDIRIDSDDTYFINPYNNIYEYNEYLVYSRGPNLYLYDTCQNKTIIISENSSQFTYNGGIIYYLRSDEEHFYIKSFNIDTAQYTNIKQLDNEILYIAFFENKLYFTYNFNEELEDGYKLFYIQLDGSGMTEMELSFPVNTFIIDGNNMIYSDIEEMPSIYLESIKGSYSILIDLTLGGYFETRDDKLFCCANEILDSSNLRLYCIDLNNGEKIEIDNNVFGEFALFGQYIIYIKRENNILYLDAYDQETGVKYKIKDLSNDEEFANIEDNIIMNTTRNNAYISRYKMDGSFTLYRIIIKEGIAELEELVYYAND